MSLQRIVLVTSNITDHYKKYNNEKVWNSAEITKMWHKETRSEKMLLGKQVRQAWGRVAINTQFILRKTNWVRAVNFCGCYPSPSSLPSSSVALKTNSFTNHNSQEKQSFNSIWRGKEGLVLPKMSCPWGFVIIWPAGSYLDISAPTACLYLTWLSSVSVNSLFPRELLSKKERKKERKVSSNNLT